MWTKRRHAEPVDPFIRPEHVCRIPQSVRYGYINTQPKNLEDQPVGTVFICDCGWAWRVTAPLGLWERDPANDVKELLS